MLEHYTVHNMPNCSLELSVDRVSECRSVCQVTHIPTLGTDPLNGM